MWHQVTIYVYLNYEQNGCLESKKRTKIHAWGIEMENVVPSMAATLTLLLWVLSMLASGLSISSASYE